MNSVDEFQLNYTVNKKTNMAYIQVLQCNLLADYNISLHFRRMKPHQSNFYIFKYSLSTPSDKHKRLLIIITKLMGF